VKFAIETYVGYFMITSWKMLASNEGGRCGEGQVWSLKSEYFLHAMQRIN